LLPGAAWTAPEIVKRRIVAATALFIGVHHFAQEGSDLLAESPLRRG